jgi:hypothetical protein
LSELRYEQFYHQSRQELAKALASGNPAEIRGALYSAAKYESDWEWTQEQCLKYLVHANGDVRWAAALSLGFIAVYQGKLDLPKVLPELHAARKDNLIAQAVEDSLEMIQQYIKRN